MERYPESIETAVNLIVDCVDPLKVILFGSAARGEDTGSSDIDLLVVMPDGTPRRETARALRRRLLSLDREVDIVVANEEDLKAHAENFSLVYYPALHEGRVVYAA